MGKKKGDKEKEKRRQRKLLKKRRKDAARKKSRTVAVSESALQHQLVASFGSPENLFKYMVHLGEMFKSEEDLKSFRFEADKIYEKLNLSEVSNKLKSLYEAENPLLYPEEDQDFWRDIRKKLLPELVTDDFAKRIAKKLEVLVQKKKGIRKDYLAASAGKLLAQMHLRALTLTEIEDNLLWELIFNLTLQENIRELPEPKAEAVEKTELKEQAATELEPKDKQQMPPEAESEKKSDTQ